MPFLPRLPLRATVASLLAVLAGLAASPAARAAEVGVGGGVLTLSGFPGEANRLTLAPVQGGYLVTQADGGLILRAGCVPAGPGQARCASTGVSRATIDLGDGDDVLTSTLALATAVDDGAGDDRITTGTGNDTFLGAPGDDVLDGGAGDDTFNDGGGLGADALTGGAGRDLVSYAERTSTVSADADDHADDGAAGERDRIATDVERLTGGRGADVLGPTPGDGELRGGDGNDVLDGGPGADALSGGGGSDRVSYGDHTAPVQADPDGTTGDDGADGERDTIATDVEDLEGGHGDDTLTGGAGANTLDGGPGGDTLRGREKDDVLRGGDGPDALDGGDGADRLDGESGPDHLSGGPGTGDTADYSARPDPVHVTIDDQADDGAPGEGDRVDLDVERLEGGSAGDVLSGAGGDETLVGGAGDDALDGGAGADTLSGGDGRDTASYAGRADGVTVDLDGRPDDGATDEGDNVKADVEELRGGSGADRLTGDGDAGALHGGPGDDVLDGGRGADLVSGGDGRDLAEYGTRGGGVAVSNDGVQDDGEGDEADNVLTDVEILGGGRGDDRLTGGDGADELRGRGGRDRLLGGAGPDALQGDTGDDRLEGGAGADAIDGGDGSDILDYDGIGTPLAVSLGGGAPDPGDTVVSVESLAGGDGADRLAGSPAADELHGRGGDDVLDGGPGADELDGGEGRDLVDYSSRPTGVRVSANGKDDDGAPGEGDAVAGSVEDVTGGAGGDTIELTAGVPHVLTGGRGADTITAGGAADRVDGGPGNDTLRPGGGLDRVDAGAGNDRIEAADGVRETIECGAGRDTVLADRADRLLHCESTKTKGGDTSTAGPSTPVAPMDTVSGVRTLVGGGRFVAIPGSPGKRIDRRLLRDIAYLKAKYKIAITSGLDMTGHAAGGEHPRGLALDIVPGPGGSWADIDRLARWAEPRQNRPRAPFRWVGYNGDAKHGRGHHLHLSWNHAPVRSGHPARWVQVLALRTPAVMRSGGLVQYARAGNKALRRTPSVRSGLATVRPCSGAKPLVPTWKAAGRAFGINWKILAAITEIESGHGCNMGPSSAGALGWTQFMPATWRSWGMDADGDGRATPSSSADAVFSSARYLRASGAPRSYRKALFAYNHADWYVRDVLKRSRTY